MTEKFEKIIDQYLENSTETVNFVENTGQPMQIKLPQLKKLT